MFQIVKAGILSGTSYQLLVAVSSPLTRAEDPLVWKTHVQAFFCKDWCPGASVTRLLCYAVSIKLYCRNGGMASKEKPERHM